MSRLANTIEAILYLKAQPLSIAQIAEFAKCDQDTAAEGLIDLMGEYAHREGALEIAETEAGYTLQLRELYKPLVDSIVPLDIGLGALRTLAAIALRGPIAQSELVDLRGSGVYQHVPDLVEQGFVKKRRQADGRSSWLQITEKFYQHFEIDKLPQISNLRLPKPLDSAEQPNGTAPDSHKPDSHKIDGAELISAETSGATNSRISDSPDLAIDELVETDAPIEKAVQQLEPVLSDQAIDDALSQMLESAMSDQE